MIFDFDRRPRCGCNNAPIIHLASGWICEDCYDKDKEVKDEQFSDNHRTNMRDSSCNHNDWQ